MTHFSGISASSKQEQFSCFALFNFKLAVSFLGFWGLFFCSHESLSALDGL